MKKIIFFIILINFIILSQLFSEFILIKGKAHSYNDFNKKYIKIKKRLGHYNNFNIIKNNYHKFKNNKFSFIQLGTFATSQNWLNLIDAKNFFSISTGKNIKIGILDSGIELTHEDLKGQIINFFNVADNNSDVTDYIGHGTSVAGIMAAKAFNNKGIIGLSPDAKYIVVKISHYNEDTFDDYSVAKGIYYLVDKGCNVINMSIQMNHNSRIVEDAIEYAKEKGVILVAASGNGGKNNESFPANNVYVLGVGSIDNNYNIASFSNYDNNTFIFAPGYNIFTTYIHNSYTLQTGTSFSAPMLTSLIADILSLNPYLSLNDIKKIIIASSKLKTADQKFSVVDLINGIKGTGISFYTNRYFYTPGTNLKVKVTLPPMSKYFNLYLGIIFGENILLLRHNKDNFYFSDINSHEDIHPTIENIILNNYLTFNLFGENGIFPEIQINNFILPGVYKFCGTYERNGNLIGYINCKNILIFNF